MSIRTTKISGLILFLLFSSIILAIESPDPVIKDQRLFDPKRPLSRELEISVQDRFKLAAVGDCIISRPLTPFMQSDEQFAKAVQFLQESDATVGNLETTILEMRNFRGHPYSWDGDWTLLTEPQVAKDLAIMGFDLFSRANNHVMDWGIEGMRETSQWLDQAGLIHAGAGEMKLLPELLIILIAKKDESELFRWHPASGLQLMRFRHTALHPDAQVSTR